jgi:uncharacterized membrane protein
LSAVAGGAVGLWGCRRKDVIGMALGAAGVTLLTRAVTDLELKRLFGIGAGFWAVTIQKTITVAAPIEEVYELWSRYEEFPRFMAHVREAQRIDDTRVRWTVAGPAAVPIHWETQETRRIPYEVIAWKTMPGARVAHAGVVRFEDDPAGTRVHVTMRYNPPAGALGHALATILGADPKRALDEDLVRFKSLLEEGKTSVRGETTRREALG